MVCLVVCIIGGESMAPFLGKLQSAPLTNHAAEFSPRKKTFKSRTLKENATDRKSENSNGKQPKC